MSVTFDRTSEQNAAINKHDLINDLMFLWDSYHIVNDSFGGSNYYFIITLKKHYTLCLWVGSFYDRVQCENLLTSKIFWPLSEILFTQWSLLSKLFNDLLCDVIPVGTRMLFFDELVKYPVQLVGPLVLIHCVVSLAANPYIESTTLTWLSVKLLINYSVF